MLDHYKVRGLNVVTLSLVGQLLDMHSAIPHFPFMIPT